METKEQSLEAAAIQIAKAAEQGARLVVLPEMFCCPYLNKAFAENAEPAGGNIWRFLSEAAKSNGIMLAGGTMPEQGEGGRLYNTCFVFNEKGEQIARHRKLHLYDVDIPGKLTFKESNTFSAGEDITVIDTVWGKLGVMVCFDVRFPELARLMALRGAEAIIVPAVFPMATGPAYWELLMQSRAIDNFTYILACASARNESAKFVSYANSLIVSPWGKTVARLETEPAVLYHELDLDMGAALREQIPVMSARRADLYSLEWKK